MKKAVFLDRDGTIIKDMIYLNDKNQIETFTESYPALELLHKAGYLIILITNQSGVARGLVQIENLEEINALIIEDFGRQKILISGAYYCPHPVDGGCECRKPNAGMLRKAAVDHDIDLKSSWMVGDRMSDVEAGRRAGCRSILLKNGTTPMVDEGFAPPEVTCANVLEAAQFILKTASTP